MREHSARRYPRTARVNQVLRQVLAESLERLLSNEGSGRLLTITDVEADPDFRRARVFLSHMDESDAEFLGEHRVTLQSAIAREVRMKRTPQLEFLADPAIESGSRIEEILHNLDHDSE